MNVLPITTVGISVLTQRVLTHVTVVRGMYLITMVEPALSTVEADSHYPVVLSIHQTGQSPIHHLTSVVSG